MNRPEDKLPTPIRFGTDGWRGIISDDFTFANLRLVAQAVADHFTEQGQANKGLVVGFDTRFLSDRYAIEVSRVLAANDIQVYLTKSDCPTPALSYAITNLGAAGGLMITASHNPPRYNGLKLKASFGGSMMPDETQQIQERLDILVREEGYQPSLVDYEAALAGKSISRIDPLPAYLDHIQSLVNLELIGRSRLRVAIDPMYGAARGYVKAFLQEAGCYAREIHGEMNPGFGGLHPEPIGRNLEALMDLVAAGPYDVGLATDGDGDRIGAVDATGRFVDPQTIFCLVLRHLVQERKLSGAVVKTVSTTQAANVMAERYGLPLFETPVGFNHICDLILKNDVLIGGEESGSITIKGHIPEADGILMALLIMEIMATHEEPLHVIIEEMMQEIGPFHYAREDVPVGPFSREELLDRLVEEVPAKIAGVRITAVGNTDGMKYYLQDDSWLLIRPSGTEPVLRIYAEGRSWDQVRTLLTEGRLLAGL